VTFRRLLRSWDRFLFAPVSPVPVAVYRICFGLLVLADLVLLLPEVDTFFGDKGIFPLADSVKMMGTHRLNVFLWLPDTPLVLHAFFALALLAALCLTVGLFTRVSAVATFVALVSIHHRNPLLLNGADTFMRQAAFCVMFMPAGRALSLDRLLAARRHRRSGDPEPVPPPQPAAPWAQRKLQVQRAVGYLSTIRRTHTGFTRHQGPAVYYATRLAEFDRFPVPYLFRDPYTIRMATWGTLVVEFALGALIWFRDLRYPIILAGVMLHLGLEYSMNIPLFQWTMITAYVLFIDPRDVRRAMDWLAARRVRRRRRASEEPTPAGLPTSVGKALDASSPETPS
jgi:hypothetical protein